MNILIDVCYILYKKVFSPLLWLCGIRCRYYIPCSTYTYLMIKDKGFCRGLLAGIKRILTCHPGSDKWKNERKYSLKDVIKRYG